MANAGGNSVRYGEGTYQLDEHGFLCRFGDWSEEFAEGMAETLGIRDGLSEDHWAFIRYLRERFQQDQSVPVVIVACAENKLRLRAFRALFPMGYFRGACRIAGINPEFMRGYWLSWEGAATLSSEYRMTPMGFLSAFENWNERFAELLAEEWGLPEGLTDRHRRIIAYLRDYYGRTRKVPTIFEACRENDVSLEDFGQLFPEGYRRGACRAAGLPFPG